MAAAPATPPRRTAAPVVALLCNAFVWGVSWWPFRHLQARGLHPLWATTIIYVVAAAVILAWRPRALRQLATEPALWVVFLASGTTNAAFNWGVSVGDVVRVVLLFYLMPLWALLLARWILREPLTPRAWLRVALAIGGAALVVAQEGGASVANPHADATRLFGVVRLPDLLAVVGGFAFALNNVMLRREAGRPEEGRALAMFVGGAVVAAATAGVLAGHGAAGVAWPLAPGAWALPVLALSLAFLGSNLCLQYGTARLSAAVAAVVMPAEVLFASLTAVWWGGATLHASVVAGGILILAATLMGALGERRRDG